MCEEIQHHRVIVHRGRCMPVAALSGAPCISFLTQYPFLMPPSVEEKLLCGIIMWQRGAVLGRDGGMLRDGAKVVNLTEEEWCIRQVRGFVGIDEYYGFIRERRVVPVACFSDDPCDRAFAYNLIGLHKSPTITGLIKLQRHWRSRPKWPSIQLCVRWLSGNPILENVDISVATRLSALRSRLEAEARRPIRALIRENSQQLHWRCTVNETGLQDGETVTAVAESYNHYDLEKFDQMELEFEDRWDEIVCCRFSGRPQYEVALKSNNYNFEMLYSVPCGNGVDGTQQPCPSWIFLDVPMERADAHRWIEHYLRNLGWFRIRTRKRRRFICPSCVAKEDF